MTQMQLPSDNSIRQLVGMYGRLRSGVHGELGPPNLVLPNAQYFPDTYDGGALSAQTLVRRMQRHAAIDDIPVRIRIGQTETNKSSSCSSGACAAPDLSPQDEQEPKLSLNSEGWSLLLSPGELGHPVALTTTIARALGAVFLEETRPENAASPQPLAIHQDITSVLLGFGVLLLEGAYIYSKGCGGPRIAQLTALSAPELAVLVALYAATEKVKLKGALRGSSTTQRALLQDAQALLQGNPHLASWVRTALPDDASPSQALGPAKTGLLGGWFAGRSTASADDGFEALLDGNLDATQLARFSPQRDQKSRNASKRSPIAPDDDLKALVAEALDSV